MIGKRKPLDTDEEDVVVAEEEVEALDEYEDEGESQETAVGKAVALLGKDMAGTVKDRSKQLARESIERFFRDQEMHYGGPIPKSVMFSPRYIDMVVNLDVSRGVEQAYLLMKQSGIVDTEPHNSGGISDDVKHVIEIHKMCRKCAIPKPFISGITMMYLELCLNIKLPRNIATCGFTKH